MSVTEMNAARIKQVEELLDTVTENTDSSIVSFAKEELAPLLENDPETGKPDPMNVEMYRAILRLMTLFSEQGHSGMSAHYLRAAMNTLMSFEPLSPLKGTDEEWVLVSEDPVMYQNNRCPRVFKSSKDGQAYDVERRIFTDEEGHRYSSGHSKVFIEFPYTPEQEVVGYEESKELHPDEED